MSCLYFQVFSRPKTGIMGVSFSACVLLGARAAWPGGTRPALISCPPCPFRAARHGVHGLREAPWTASSAAAVVVVVVRARGSLLVQRVSFRRGTAHGSRYSPRHVCVCLVCVSPVCVNT